MAKPILKKATVPLILLVTTTRKATLMCYCLGLVNLENKVVYAKSNDTAVFTMLLGNYEKLNGLTLLVALSNEKWINLTKLYKQLGAEKAKALISFHCLSGCNNDEKFT